MREELDYLQIVPARASLRQRAPVKPTREDWRAHQEAAGVQVILSPALDLPRRRRQLADVLAPARGARRTPPTPRSQQTFLRRLQGELQPEAAMRGSQVAGYVQVWSDLRDAMGDQTSRTMDASVQRPVSA